MDVLNVTEELTLYDVELRHKISIPGYMGKTTHIMIFQDKEANTYYWVTASYSTKFCEGQVYNIKAELDRTKGNRLGFVRIIESSTAAVQSEQPDALDILLGKANYTDIHLTKD